jgi:eukaryotic-like serine/threonine-protein kinase
MLPSNSSQQSEYPRVAGRYVLFEPFARGGMASVHLGRLIGPAGFSRTVAIKRMHEQFAHNPEFVAMFLDEARLAARINHPNVVPTLDVAALKFELLLVMEYICGESLMGLLTRSRESRRPPPIPVAVDCAIGMLNGLHAAHEAKQADGRLLSIVHRDVTPHNVLIGLDGVTRVVDFGIAKAAGSAHRTRIGEIKGKLAYLAPEQLQGGDVSRATDIYSATLVLWESLTCERLFKGDNEGAIIHSVLDHRVKPPSALRRDIPPELDSIVLRGLDADPRKRWETAKAMAEALESVVSPVTRSAVAAWVQETASSELLGRQERLAYVESYSMPGISPSSSPQLLNCDPPQFSGSLAPTLRPRGTPDGDPLSFSGSVSGVGRDDAPLTGASPADSVVDVPGAETGISAALPPIVRVRGDRRNWWLVLGGAVALMCAFLVGVASRGAHPAAEPLVAKTSPLESTPPTLPRAGAAPQAQPEASSAAVQAPSAGATSTEAGTLSPPTLGRKHVNPIPAPRARTTRDDPLYRRD